MRINVELDDEMLQRAMEITGLKTKKAVIELGLRRIVYAEQAAALEALWGLVPDWEGDLKALRRNRELPD